MTVRRIAVDALQVARTYSGVGRQVLAIGVQLHDLPGGLELEVRCSRESRPLLERAFPAGTRFRTPLRRSRPRLLRVLYQQVVRPALDGRDTLLVCLGDQGPLWGRPRMVLVVNDVRRLAHPETSPRLEALYYRAIVPRAARRAVAVLTISEFSRARLRALLGDALRVDVVSQPLPAVQPRGHVGGAHVLVVGALRAYKGLETAVEALALLPPSDRPPLVVAGPNEGHGDRVASCAHERGVAAVRLAGWVSDEELDALYADALAVVQPSGYEGYGLAVAESLARGLPTLASDIPAHREVGGEALLYFPPGDAEALAARLRDVVRDPALRSELARLALARAEELRRSGLSWRDALLGAAAA